MMQIGSFRKKFFRTIFSISIIFIFSTDVLLPKNNTLKLIEDYLGDIRTLQAKFSQTDYMGDIMTGDMFLKKPGKIRFSYDPPYHLQIVSKQQAVLIFDLKNSGDGPLTYPLSYTPLEFLIKNDLSLLINENSESFELMIDPFKSSTARGHLRSGEQLQNFKSPEEYVDLRTNFFVDVFS